MCWSSLCADTVHESVCQISCDELVALLLIMASWLDHDAGMMDGTRHKLVKQKSFAKGCALWSLYDHAH